MAINILSGNLNQFANGGNFETDPSTWGYTTDFTQTRITTDGTNGISCARLVALGPTFDGGAIEKLTLLQGRFLAQPFKKYLIKAKVKTLTSNPIASDTCRVALEPDADFAGLITLDQRVSIIAAKDVWSDVEIRVTNMRAYASLHKIDLFLEQFNFGNIVLDEGELRVDAFEIYEYEEAVVVCTLNFNVAGTVVVNESAPGANDGSITVASSGGTAPLQYSKNFGAGIWQSSNVFTGLTGGSYQITIRDSSSPVCLANATIVVNTSPPVSSFDFPTTIVNESTAGANDGQVTVGALTGTYTAPVTYSKAGPGGPFVAGNVFSALPPGNYNISVKDNTGITVTKSVTVAAGGIISNFDYTPVVTHESSYLGNNGQVVLGSITGTYAAPLTYSKNGGATYQAGNTFSALAPGSYVVVVKDNTGLTLAKTIVINAFAFPFNFTTAVLPETVAGANDGKVTITAIGPGPFTYSKDDVTYQVSNIFSGLAPGTYPIFVKNAGGLKLGVVVTIAAGAAIFDKVYFHKNFIPIVNVADSDWAVQTNYRLYADVRVEDVAGSGTYNSKMAIEQVPDAAAKVTFQIRQAFVGVMKPVPPTLNAIMQRITDRIKLFKYHTGELTGTQIIPASLAVSLPNLVLYGGVDKFSFAESNFFADLITNKRFLTRAPLTKLVDRNQEDYLNYFVFNVSTTIVRLRIKAYYDDNTNQSATISSLFVIYGQLIQVPAGTSNSGVAGINPAKTLVKYEVSLLNQADILISEVHTYTLDPFRYPNTRMFMFLNSLGTFEVIRFYGQAQISNSFDRQVSKKYLPVGYAALDGEKAVRGTTRKKKANYSSGYFTGDDSDAWLDYMNDFMLTDQLYEVTDGKRRPVIITDGTVESEDQNYKRFFRFTAEDAYDNNVYTP